jgi:hypothetical protein
MLGLILPNATVKRHGKPITSRQFFVRLIQNSKTAKNSNNNNSAHHGISRLAHHKIID